MLSLHKFITDSLVKLSFGSLREEPFNMSKFRVADHVAYRTGEPAKETVEPVEYEKEIYQHGLKLQRPAFTFQTGKWQEEAEARMSAESKGYVCIIVEIRLVSQVFDLRG